MQLHVTFNALLPLRLRSKEVQNSPDRTGAIRYLASVRTIPALHHVTRLHRGKAHTLPIYLSYNFARQMIFNRGDVDA